ncbi:L,D-transpeptidase family protein [Palleronia sp. KMU-117]|uniref:L,D-transpeptidase family protein n=1 Tax=Palleronia sp. KMU-117 TaxID=3434108 RepID=UPI003D75C763
MAPRSPRGALVARILALGAALILAGVAAAASPSAAFRQAVAEAAAGDRDIAAFYQAADYQPIWTGTGREDRARREALLRAVSEADDHGLPEGRYDADDIAAAIRAARSESDLGRLEVDLSRAFLRYARDVQTGFITPASVDPDIVREVPLRDRRQLLLAFAASTPDAFLRALPPKSQEYTRLMKAKFQLERTLGQGGWGPTVEVRDTLRPGDQGPGVIALRNRLIAMGYLGRTATTAFDARMQSAVAAFQSDHGLTADGVAGPSTIAELNVPVETRLGQVMVAMERERWMNTPEGRGKTHIWVNLPDFHMQLVDDGKVTFQTRAVVGENRLDKHTPEFSDMMTYMEVNPDWTVPRSILARDYLPKFQANPNAARYLQLIDSSGRQVSREAIDFSRYTARNFPFTVRQAPGDANALGRVKFMFPNPHAIYLHDTPAKELFSREVRAYSSGCIRLNDPFDFAYELLSRQMANPKPYFDGILATGRQTRVDLETPIPVHLVYRTAFTDAKGRVQYRRDFYGRDAMIWDAMRAAGVALRAVRS